MKTIINGASFRNAADLNTRTSAFLIPLKTFFMLSSIAKIVLNGLKIYGDYYFLPTRLTPMDMRYFRSGIVTTLM